MGDMNVQARGYEGVGQAVQDGAQDLVRGHRCRQYPLLVDLPVEPCAHEPVPEPVGHLQRPIVQEVGGAQVPGLGGAEHPVSISRKADGHGLRRLPAAHRGAVEEPHLAFPGYALAELPGILPSLIVEPHAQALGHAGDGGPIGMTHDHGHRLVLVLVQ